MPGKTMWLRSRVFALLGVGVVACVVSPPAVAETNRSAFAYVTDNAFGQLGHASVIDTSTNQVVDTVTVGSEPRGVAITPDGAFAYVVNQATLDGNTVSVIQTSTDSVIATVAVGTNPAQVAITPDGKFA